jgi:TolB-like protein/Tfp pilus assembly protein PilF
MKSGTRKSIVKSKLPESFEGSVRHQLAAILKSRSFRQVERLQRFLTFIVEENLAGRGELLKEYSIGIDVFEKEQDFDPRMDPIVRVQARRLRMRLADYYKEEGRKDPIIIALPKGGYIPLFSETENAVSKSPPGAALISQNTLSVLPFTNHSSSEEVGHFCSGLSLEITNSLAKENSLIIVTNDTMRLGRSEGEPTAAMVVSGGVRKSGDTVRITMHLNDAVRGSLMWSQSIDRRLGDVFVIQEEVAQLVLRTVRAELVAGKDKKATGRTQNLAAHNLYLQGRYHLNQRTEQGLRRAVDFFSKAITEDTQLAEAYAGLADADNLLAHYGVLAPADVWTKAAANAAQAVMLDGESAEAHTSFAHIKSTQDWDWKGSEKEFQRAISLNPRYPPAHHWYAVSCLTPLGRLDEALEQMLMAQALDPVSSIISRDIALNHYYRRDLESALEQCDHTIEQNPYFSAAYWTLGLVQEERGDLDEAVAAFQRAIELSPPSLRILGALGRAFAKAGKKEKALQVLHQLEDLALRRYISPFELALIYFALGRKDEGFQRLAKAYQDRCYELVTIKVDPRFDSVAKDARFAALIRQIGLP